MADPTPAVLDAVALLQSKAEATLVLLVTDRAEVAAEVRKRCSVAVLLATADPDVAEEAASEGHRVVRLSEGATGLALLPRTKEILLNAYLQGDVGPKDRVLCLATDGAALDAIVLFDVARDLELGHLRGEVEARVPMDVMDRVLRLGAEIAREGREGNAVGTLFILGDVERVLAHSRQAVLNPFAGHPPAARSVLNDEAWETLKEFAQLDGAFVIREDGVVEAAGRYVRLEDGGTVQAGLGGRHLAAASVTRLTRAIAVAVSSSGAIRVFKDGRVVIMVGTQ